MEGRERGWDFQASETENEAWTEGERVYQEGNDRVVASALQKLTMNLRKRPSYDQARGTISLQRHQKFLSSRVISMIGL